MIVQEDYDTAISATLATLKRGLLHSGLIALGLVALVMAGLWGNGEAIERERVISAADADLAIFLRRESPESRPDSFQERPRSRGRWA